MVTPPDTRYAKSGDISIAYQVVGSGSVDLVMVPGFISHLDLQWQQDPIYRAWIERLASFCRVILFDKRGSGLSDRDVGDSTLEERMDDLRALWMPPDPSAPPYSDSPREGRWRSFSPRPTPSGSER